MRLYLHYLNVSQGLDAKPPVRDPIIWSTVKMGTKTKTSPTRFNVAKGPDQSTGHFGRLSPFRNLKSPVKLLQSLKITGFLYLIPYKNAKIKVF